MTTKIKMWGNSLAVRIPKNASEKLRLKDGSPIMVKVKKNEIAIQPVRKKKPSLKELVDSITPENRHELIFVGRPWGKEVW